MYNTDLKKFSRLSYLMPPSKTKIICPIPQTSNLALVTNNAYITLDAISGEVKSHTGVEIG